MGETKCASVFVSTLIIASDTSWLKILFQGMGSGSSAQVGLAFTCDGKELCPHASTQPPLPVTVVEEPPSTQNRKEEIRKSFINNLEFTIPSTLSKRQLYQFVYY